MRTRFSLSIDVRGVEVQVEGAFGGVGEPATNVRYRAKVTVAVVSAEDARRLLERTDEVAEVQNTLRVGVPVYLDAMNVETI